VKIFGIDPGSERTGYGCVETDGFRHRLVGCGAIASPASTPFPDRLLAIHTQLRALLRQLAPDCVAIENLFFATNVKSALKLGHARGVAMLAAVEAGLPVIEYTPAEIKRAVVGYGRAEKHQVQQMVKLILGLSVVPSPHDVADALAVAICHVHSHRALLLARPSATAGSNAPEPIRRAGPAPRRRPAGATATNWRTYRPALAPGALRRGKPARS
jgi:crossover junction endodeoxyribonuclease RuvC